MVATHLIKSFISLAAGHSSWSDDDGGADSDVRYCRFDDALVQAESSQPSALQCRVPIIHGSRVGVSISFDSKLFSNTVELRFRESADGDEFTRKYSILAVPFALLIAFWKCCRVALRSRREDETRLLRL
jgi:hypothetical protein